MHNRALLCYMNSECVLECRDTPKAGNNLIPISVPFYCSYVCRLCIFLYMYMHIVTLFVFDSLSLADC